MKGRLNLGHVLALASFGTLFGMIWLEMLGRQAIESMLTKTAIALVCIMLGVVGLAVAEPRKED